MLSNVAPTNFWQYVRRVPSAQTHPIRGTLLQNSIAARKVVHEYCRNRDCISSYLLRICNSNIQLRVILRNLALVRLSLRRCPDLTKLTGLLRALTFGYGSHARTAREARALRGFLQNRRSL